MWSPGRLPDAHMSEPGSTPIRQGVPERPPWARRLDRLMLGLAPVLRRILPRPSDSSLQALARPDRGPAPEILLPDLPDIERARQAFATGAYGEALHLFGEILAVDATNPWAWHGRGDALQLLGQHAAALEAYERAHSLQPKEPLHEAGRQNALRGLAGVTYG